MADIGRHGWRGFERVGRHNHAQRQQHGVQAVKMGFWAGHMRCFQPKISDFVTEWPISTIFTTSHGNRCCFSDNT
jgi:hypothetical protein